MTLKNKSKRIIALALSAAIMGTGSGISTLAGSITVSADSEISAPEEKENKEVTTVTELKSERTENSNTYLLSDGSKKLEIYGEAIRYKEDGEWAEYDTALTDLAAEDKEQLEDIIGEDADKYVKVNTKD